MNSELHHLAAAYALDALDAHEREAFELHYPACDVCSNEVAEFSLTAAILAERSLIEPRSEVRALVMDQVSKTRQVSPLVEPITQRPRLEQDEKPGLSNGQGLGLGTQGGRSSRTGRFLFAAAAAVLLGVVGTLAVAGRAEDADLVAQLLEAPDAEVTSLEGESGTLQVVWSAELDRVAVLGSSLPDPGPGKIYELWFLVDDGVVRAGLFAPSESGDVRSSWDVSDLDTNGWGVTIEPLGGSESPTSEVIYVGTF